jgi:hypothetical protein
VLASTPLDTETKAKIDELGPVQCVFILFLSAVDADSKSQDIFSAPTLDITYFSVRHG